MDLFNGLFKTKKDAGKGPISSTPNKITVKKTTRLDRTSSTTPAEKSGTPKKWFSKSSKPPAKSQISQISSSTPSLVSGTKRQQTEPSTKKKPRPTSAVISSTNVTLRRGQQQSSKGDHQNQQQQQREGGGGDLSRASSATNLNAEVTSRGGQSAAKGAKPRKAESRDRIDKIAVGGGGAAGHHHHQGSDGGKNKKAVAASKNNNKEQNDVFNHLHQQQQLQLQQQQQQQLHHHQHQNNELLVDVEILQRQLAQMASEKSSLALQLGEQTGQLNSLQGEVVKLKMLQEQSNHQMEQLVEENSLLRNRLKDVSHSPLSDNEKQQLLFESHRHHSSAPASIATNVLDDGGDMTACPTPEWDKHSSGNVSEISVACLQDKINQMQETHYSTNEELQATLQELTDLQRQLTELQQENERLIEEKNLMFESLCRQTERLNDSRNEVESLKQLLYKDDMVETAAEREQKLVDLLTSAQEEREVLLVKQEQLGNDLEDSRSANLMHSDEILQLSERVRTLESSLDAKHAEHKLIDQELAQARDQSSGRQIEINRLKDLLENARTKISEMEQDRTLSDKSELDEMLDNARKEKDMLESEVAHLKEQLALSKNETEKLKEQVSVLQEECKVTRNNAKTTQSDLEYKCDKLAGEKAVLAEQLQNFQEAVQELQVQAQCHADDKRQLSAVLSETQRNLNESERRIMALEGELGEVKRLRQEQEEEWEKFQNDLLTSVRVANDFKTEAQQDLQKLIMENKAERERVRQLEAQIDKLKGVSTVKQSPLKRREKKQQSTSRGPRPRLSKEEELLLGNLDKMYEAIDPNLPEHQLTEEQKVVKRLKTIFDEEDVANHQRPKAPKPKDKLAISKPLLDSVISNPKLGEIANDPKVQSVERFSLNEEDFGPLELNRRTFSPPASPNLPQQAPPPTPPAGPFLLPTVPRASHSSPVLPPADQWDESSGKSKSLNDLSSPEPPLRRFDNREDLSRDIFEPRRNSSVTFATVEQICKGIDPSLPLEQLTKEQRLALRLKETLDNGERKTTLKKNLRINRKKIVISTPTKESVEQNYKLSQVLNDEAGEQSSSNQSLGNQSPREDTLMPVVEPARSSIFYEKLDVPLTSQRSSGSSSGKRYDDISFTFDSKPINMYSSDDEDHVEKTIPPPVSFMDDHQQTLRSFSTDESNAPTTVEPAIALAGNQVVPEEVSRETSVEHTAGGAERDPAIFRHQTDTYKKEHNYLDRTTYYVDNPFQSLIDGDMKSPIAQEDHQNDRSQKVTEAKLEEEYQIEYPVSPGAPLIAPEIQIEEVEDEEQTSLDYAHHQRLLNEILDSEEGEPFEVYSDALGLDNVNNKVVAIKHRRRYLLSSSEEDEDQDEKVDESERKTLASSFEPIEQHKRESSSSSEYDPEMEFMDEEDKQIRRGLKKVYNQVVQEIKEKNVLSQGDLENLKEPQKGDDRDDVYEQKQNETDQNGVEVEEKTDVTEQKYRNQNVEPQERPLSDITPEDLAMIEELKRRYDVEDEELGVVLLAEKVQKPQLHLAQQFEINQPVHFTLHIEENKPDLAEATLEYLDSYSEAQTGEKRESSDEDKFESFEIITFDNADLVTTPETVQMEDLEDWDEKPDVVTEINLRDVEAIDLQGMKETKDLGNLLKTGNVIAFGVSKADETSSSEDEAVAKATIGKYADFGATSEDENGNFEASKPRTAKLQDLAKNNVVGAHASQSDEKSHIESETKQPLDDSKESPNQLEQNLENDQDAEVRETRPRISEVLRKEHISVFPKPFEHQTPIYEPVYANLNALDKGTKVSSKESFTRISEAKKPKALPRVPSRPLAPPPLPPSAPPQQLPSVSSEFSLPPPPISFSVPASPAEAHSSTAHASEVHFSIHPASKAYSPAFSTSEAGFSPEIIPSPYLLSEPFPSTELPSSSSLPPLPLSAPPHATSHPPFDRVESSEEQVSEEFGGSLRKTNFTIRYLDKSEKIKQELKRNSSRGKRASVNELRKMFEDGGKKKKTSEELPNNDSIDRMVTFHVLNNLPSSSTGSKKNTNNTSL